MIRKTAFITFCIASIALPAKAGEPSNIDDALIQAHKVANQIAEKVIEEYCDKPVPEPQKDQIIIYYERDENGKCVSRFKTTQTDAQKSR